MYIKNLDDVDEGVLRELISSPVKAVMKIYSEWMKKQQNYMGLANSCWCRYWYPLGVAFCNMVIGAGIGVAVGTVLQER